MLFCMLKSSRCDKKNEKDLEKKTKRSRQLYNYVVFALLNAVFSAHGITTCYSPDETTRNYFLAMGPYICYVKFLIKSVDLLL